MNEKKKRKKIKLMPPFTASEWWKKIVKTDIMFAHPRGTQLPTKTVSSIVFWIITRMRSAEQPFDVGQCASTTHAW